MIAYHFTGDTLRDGSPIPPIGHKLVMDGPILICNRGYHWSLHPFDALKYAPGCLLHKIKASGTIQQQSDKGVSSERTIIQTTNAEELLRKAARMYALNVIHLWDAPDVVKKYLQTGDKKLQSAAQDAARAAARAAAWAAARDAAGDAAGDDVRDAQIEMVRAVLLAQEVQP